MQFLETYKLERMLESQVHTDTDQTETHLLVIGNDQQIANKSVCVQFSKCTIQNIGNKLTAKMAI